MAYLYLSPAIAALRARPEEFEFSDDALHHLSSRHRFRFDSEGDVRIDALCDCSLLRARPEQGQVLPRSLSRMARILLAAFGNQPRICLTLRAEAVETGGYLVAPASIGHTVGEALTNTNGPGVADASSLRKRPSE